MPDDSIWQEEAKAKNLPQDFVERLASSDAVTEAEKAKLIASVSSATELKQKRDTTIALGRRYGEDEAMHRRETGETRGSRRRRAMAYAAWEFDGKPAGGAHLKEFGISQTLTPSLERTLSPRLLQK